jgi:hypothetical protein
MHTIRTASGRNVVPVAHRGLFLSNTREKMAPENSMRALKNAACRGAWAVEIDLRLLGDGTVILMHDDSPSRTTNADPFKGNFLLQRDGIIKDANNKVLRNRRAGIAASAKNSSYTRASLRAALQFRKLYKASGYYVGNTTFGSVDNIFLDTFLTRVKNDPTLSAQVLVLDIQNFAVFERTYAIVKKLGMFNRVIFKLWSEAIPVVQLSESDPQLYLRAVDNGAALQGSFVLASNAMNTRWNATTKNWEMKFHNAGTGRDQFFVYEDFPNIAGYGHANTFLGEFRDTARKSNSLAIVGYEFVIGATAASANVDRFLRARRTDLFGQTRVPAEYSVTWGVDRGIDLNRTECTTDCATFPNARYGAWTDTLYAVPASVRSARNTFGREASVVVSDMIY